MNAKMKIIVTGAAGFIGGHVMEKLSKANYEVLGIDNFSSYYSPSMKSAHIDKIVNSNVLVGDVCDRTFVFNLFNEYKPDFLVHLAAQGGVRASKVEPFPYLATNQSGFLNVIEAAELVNVKKFIYASSSSVYGEGLETPFREDARLFAPKSLYALSKLSNEYIALNLPSNGMQRIGLRFFTVYGPWGRPDMAIFRLLASSLLNKEFILTGNLEIVRDFTYVNDVVDCISFSISDLVKLENEIFNVAGSNPHSLSQLVNTIQDLGIELNVRKTDKNSLDIQKTHGSSEKLNEYGFPIPSTLLKVGIKNTWNWLCNQNLNDLKEWFDYKIH